MRVARCTVASRWAMTRVVRLGGQAGQRFLHGQLAFRVERAGRLVEQQDRRIAQQRAGERDALALTAGERHAALAEPGGVALRHGPDEAVGLGRLGGAHDIGVAGVGAPVADVLGDRVVEQGNVLRHQGDARSERLRVDVADGRPSTETLPDCGS